MAKELNQARVVKPIRKDEVRFVDNEYLRVSEGTNKKFRSGKSFIAEVDKGLAIVIGTAIASIITGIAAWIKNKRK